MPVIIQSSGTYIFERGNPCGITTDTFVVIELPTSLPTWNDTSFCNTAVFKFLEAGAGWDNYDWGAASSINYKEILATTPGFYQVIATNICATDSTSITIEQQTYPIPNIGQFNIGTPFCADTLLELNPSPGFTYDSYNWTWGSAGSTDSALYITGDTLTGSNTYTVDISMGFGCYASATDSFAFYDEPLQQKICIATVDTTSGYNMIIWENDHDTTIFEYEIYRNTGSYVLIGTVSADSNRVFIDTLSDPASAIEEYTIVAISRCGARSIRSYYIMTMLLQVGVATSGGNNLSWSKYKDESGAFTPSGYVIYRRTASTAWSIIYTTSGNVTTYNDITAPTGAEYVVGVALPFDCDSLSQSKGKGNGSMSFSNIRGLSTSIGEIQLETNISIYPNPSTGIFQIRSNLDITEISVYNTFGQLILSTTNENKIDLSEYPKGVYYATMITTFGQSTKRLLLN